MVTSAPSSQVPSSHIVISIPDDLEGMTIGEFIDTEVKQLRSSVLLARPKIAGCPYKTMREMSLPYFVEHCRGWHLIDVPAAGVCFVIQLSKRLEAFKVRWG